MAGCRGRVILACAGKAAVATSAGELPRPGRPAPVARRIARDRRTHFAFGARVQEGEFRQELSPGERPRFRVGHSVILAEILAPRTLEIVPKVAARHHAEPTRRRAGTPAKTPRTPTRAESPPAAPGPGPGPFVTAPAWGRATEFRHQFARRKWPRFRRGHSPRYRRGGNRGGRGRHRNEYCGP
jgi:hypothetical protein